MSQSTTNEISSDVVTLFVITTICSSNNPITPTTVLNNAQDEGNENGNSNGNNGCKQSNNKPVDMPSGLEVATVTLTKGFINLETSDDSHNIDRDTASDKNSNIFISLHSTTSGVVTCTNTKMGETRIPACITLATAVDGMSTGGTKGINDGQPTFNIAGNDIAAEVTAVPARRSTLTAVGREMASHTVQVNANAGISNKLNDSFSTFVSLFIIRTVIA